MDIQFDSSQTPVYVHAAGEYRRIEDFNPLLLALFTYPRTSDIQHRAFLVDCTNVKGEMSATEKLMIAMNVEKSFELYGTPGAANIRVAFVVPKRWISPAFRPTEDHFRKNNLPFTVCADPGSARDWLGASPAIPAR